MDKDSLIEEIEMVERLEAAGLMQTNKDDFLESVFPEDLDPQYCSNTYPGARAWALSRRQACKTFDPCRNAPVNPKSFLPILPPVTQQQSAQARATDSKETDLFATAHRHYWT